MVTPTTGCRCTTPDIAEEGDFCQTCGKRILVDQIQGPAVIGPDLAVVTDIGKRHARNEDAGAVLCEVVDGQAAFGLVVCDGVSTGSCSDRLAAAATATARAALIEVLRAGPDGNPGDGLSDAICAAHRAACAIHLEPEPGKDLPGATIVAAVAWPGHVSVGWLGDSRAYWVTETDATPLTSDDSWVVEQVASGALTPEQAATSPDAHAITHCIGPLEGVDDGDPTPGITPHIWTFNPATAGRLVLCSDGLWNYAAEPEDLAALVHGCGAEADAESVAGALVQYALERGGVDNVTVAIARLPQS